MSHPRFAQNQDLNDTQSTSVLGSQFSPAKVVSMPSTRSPGTIFCQEPVGSRHPILNRSWRSKLHRTIVESIPNPSSSGDSSSPSHKTIEAQTRPAGGHQLSRSTMNMLWRPDEDEREPIEDEFSKADVWLGIGLMSLLGGLIGFALIMAVAT